MSRTLKLTTGEDVEVNEAQWAAIVQLHQTPKQPATVVLQGKTILWNTIIGLDNTKKSMYERMVEMGCNMEWYRGSLKKEALNASSTT